MEKDSKVYVAGHRGLVGSALVRVLKANGFTNIVSALCQSALMTAPSAVLFVVVFPTQRPSVF